MTAPGRLCFVIGALAALTLLSPVAHGAGRNASPIAAPIARRAPAQGFTAPPQRPPPVVSRYTCTVSHFCKPHVTSVIRDHRSQPGPWFPHR